MMISCSLLQKVPNLCAELSKQPYGKQYCYYESYQSPKPNRLGFDGSKSANFAKPPYGSSASTDFQDDPGSEFRKELWYSDIDGWWFFVMMVLFRWRWWKEILWNSRVAMVVVAVVTTTILVVVAACHYFELIHLSV